MAKLVKRRTIGQHPVYDISVSKHENFLAENVVVHNSGARKFCEEVQPNSIDDLAVITAIYRPGPLKANVHLQYVEAKQLAAEGKLQFPHPIIEEVLGKTYGFIAFQEQFMLLSQKIGGFTPAESDALRKTLVKKSLDTLGKKGDEREAARQKFIEGGVQNHNIDRHILEELWEKISFFSIYGFNKSLHYKTMIDLFTRDGEYTRTAYIPDVKPGEYVQSRDEDTQEYIFTRVVDVHDHGTQEVFEVTLNTGETVQCTMEHKFRTTCGKMLPLWQILQDKLSIYTVNSPVEAAT